MPAQDATILQCAGGTLRPWMRLLTIRVSRRGEADLRWKLAPEGSRTRTSAEAGPGGASGGSRAAASRRRAATASTAACAAAA